MSHTAFIGRNGEWNSNKHVQNIPKEHEEKNQENEEDEAMAIAIKQSIEEHNNLQSNVL